MFAGTSVRLILRTGVGRLSRSGRRDRRRLLCRLEPMQSSHHHRSTITTHIENFVFPLLFCTNYFLHLFNAALCIFFELLEKLYFEKHTNCVEACAMVEPGVVPQTVASPTTAAVEDSDIDVRLGPDEHVFRCMLTICGMFRRSDLAHIVLQLMKVCRIFQRRQY